MNIDIVIPWVNGSDPRHQRKLEHYLPRHKNLLDEATAPHRWADNGELLLCLKSIQVYAPWVKMVYIITDQQTPELKGLNREMKNKIKIVDHEVIFRDYEHNLPIFNSISICTMAWRIPCLSDQFILMNDDLFFCSEVKPTDFFNNGAVVLRGSWKKVSDLKEDNIHSQDQFNASRLSGYSGDDYFSAAHVAHAIDRLELERLYFEMQHEFERNISFRFRDVSQFSISTLHAHVTMKEGRSSLSSKKDWLSISRLRSRSENVKKIQKQIKGFKHMKLGCVNDMAAVRNYLPDVDRCLSKSIGIETRSITERIFQEATRKLRRLF